VIDHHHHHHYSQIKGHYKEIKTAPRNLGLTGTNINHLVNRGAICVTAQIIWLMTATPAKLKVQVKRTGAREKKDNYGLA